MTATAEAVARWKPAEVVAAAKELIHSSNYEKVGEARASVDNVIAEWVRVATSDPSVVADDALRRTAEQAIIQLWALYAALEIELRQFKQATKVFESGVSCPITGPTVPFWLQYAAFCIERKKFSNARKVFVRALRAVDEKDHGELWTRFHAFVNEHLDANMSLQSLQMQVFPDKTFAGASEPLGDQPGKITDLPVGKKPECAVVALTDNVKSACQGKYGQDVTAAATAPPVDPNIAFIDKTGSADIPNAGAKRKLSDAANASPAKQAKVGGAADPTGDVDDVKSFLHIPTTLPVTPACPHLLFDQMDTQRPIDNELLERLSTVLSDSAVFQGVKDLYDNQRQRDRDMLYRWQDLVGMQMKEGSELFARHADLEKSVTEPRELIDLKTKHLGQRREFVNRCQMSQQQFIEICEMDRVSALRAQQISLENMKIPEMTITTDAAAIGLQRAILGLILEAERLSREETTKKVEEQPRSRKPNFAQKSGPRMRSDSRDRDAYPRGGGRGGRSGGSGYGRGGGSFGRAGGFRRPYHDSPPRGGRGPPKRHDGYAPAAAPAHRTYDNPPPRQNHASFQGNSQRTYAHGPAPGRGYNDHQPRDRPAHFDRGQDRRQPAYNRGPPVETAAPPLRFADTPPARSGPGYPAQDSYRRPGPQMGGQGGRGPPAARHVEYDRGAQYGAPQHDHGAYSAPPPANRYGGEPVAPMQHFGAPPNSYDYAPPNSAPYGYQNHLPPQQQAPPVQQHIQYAQPAPVYEQQPPGPGYQQQYHQPPPHHQQQQQPPQQSVYGAPPAYQQQHNAPQPQPHHQPQQHRPHQQQHRPPYQTSPPRRGGGNGGYDRFRRGGGGGRYGRKY